jgi:hypothetical protein
MTCAVVIHSNQEYRSDDVPFPPVGTTGTVLSGPDRDGDYEVLFDDYPIVSPVDPGWFAHKTMLAFFDGGGMRAQVRALEQEKHDG